MYRGFGMPCARSVLREPFPIPAVASARTLQSGFMRVLNRMSILVAVVAALALYAGCRNAPEGEGRDPATVQSPTEGGEGAEGGEAAGGHVFDPADQWNLANSPVKGSEDAIVTIVEFSEFQCPFCSRVVPTMTQVLEEFDGQVRVVFKNLPLSFHDRARPAAIAGRAAYNQGLFWEFHDLAFANQRELTDENFLAWAEQIGADMDQFRADLASEEVAAAVDADAELAGTLGIRGTPNFMINGRALTGAQPFDAFATVIREEIEATQALIDDGKSPSEAYASRLEANRSGAAAGNAQQPERQQPQARQEPDPNAELYVPVGESPVLGPEDALITIAVFSEFQCPFCARVEPTLAQVRETYGDDVRFVFKHNPLSFHDRAVPAAQAAIAAQNQGKFWEFHDIAFEHQRELTDENFIAWAEELGLNIDRFRADMASPETAARIAADQELAGRLMASGTPHFFINGYRLRGAQPFNAFQTLIDARLEEARALVSAGTPRAQVYDRLQEDAERGRAPTITVEAPAQQQAPPEPEGPFEIETDGFPAIGADNGQVVMVEYSDYTCGYCRRFHGTIHEALEGYEDRVTVVFKHFPRGNPDIAIAAEAAHRQGKFWEFSDAVFERNIRDAAGLEALAEELGLNMDNWRAVRDDPETRTFVMAQRQEGSEMGVRGTPTWFVNGNRYVGAYDTARLRSTWDEHMDD